MPPLLLLDMDGTIVDTLGFIIECFRRAVRPYVKRLPTDEEIVATFGPAEAECIARLLSRYDRESLLLGPLHAEDIARSAAQFHELYHAGYAGGQVEPYPGILEIIADAKATGWLLGVFTGKGKVSALDTLEHLGLTSQFDVVVTSDDVARPKPAPDGVRLAAWQVSTTPERTLFVGDNPADIIAGKQAGATTVAALWGAFDRNQTLAAEPDFSYEQPSDLRSLLTKWKMAS